VLQCVAVCCSVLQCVAVCCSVLQCVAVCCSVFVLCTPESLRACGKLIRSVSLLLCDITHSYVQRDWTTCMPWLIPTCDTPHSLCMYACVSACVCLCACVRTWLQQAHEIRFASKGWQGRKRHDIFVCVTLLVTLLMTLRIHTWEMQECFAGEGWGTCK